VVRLVRIHAESDVAPAGLAELARAGPLDVLQLDYERPRIAAVADGADAELPTGASSICSALTALCSSLFLEPEFRIITSAGWSDSYGAVERVGRALAAGGNPDLPVSAVRGANLMGILDDLAADGMPLDNLDTGAPWKSLREPVLAADLRLGAGPILTALNEGARVIMAGCYDGAAAAIAASVRAYGWGWKQFDCLAGAAAAARAAIWPHRHACDALTTIGALPATHIHPRVDIGDGGAFTVDLSHECEPADADQLLAWLRAGGPRDPAHWHADVRFDASRAAVAHAGPTQLRAAGLAGAASDDSWRLDVLYQAGYCAETMIEFAPGTAGSLRRQVAEAFHAHYRNADDERSLVTVQELASAAGEGAASWLHVACRSKLRPPCVEFAQQIARFAAANPRVVRLPAGRPAVQAECELWPTRVPRRAIDVAVDTRPAKEWE
jgi:hypothetical protein